MTITNRIKQNLLNAEMNYLYHLDSYKKEYPNGTNFCYETVNAKQASACLWLYKAESEYNTLLDLVNTESTEEQTRDLIDKMNNAKTEEEYNKAEKAYFDLFSIK